jgi:hypothetical protein
VFSQNGTTKWRQAVKSMKGLKAASFQRIKENLAIKRGRELIVD